MARFVYYNANPYGDIEEDCVCRAIQTAFDMPYFEVAHKLFLIGDLYDCEPLSVCCYRHLLEDVYKLQCYDGGGRTVGEVAQDYGNCILLIRIDGHLTMSEHSVVKDIWDCTDEIVDMFWIVE